MREMSKKHIGIIAIASVVIVCTASIGYIAYSGVWKDWIAGEWKNSYDFSIFLGTTENVYNVTLYLPLLMINDEVSPLMYEIDYPSNWTWNITDTEYGKMLKISAEIITAGGYSISAQKNVTSTINTRNPVENEPILHPISNFTEVNKYTDPLVTIATYQSCIYANYNSSDTGELSIHIRFSGKHYRETLMWDGIQCDLYRQTIYYTIYGGAHMWHMVNVSLERDK